MRICSSVTPSAWETDAVAHACAVNHLFGILSDQEKRASQISCRWGIVFALLITFSICKLVFMLSRVEGYSTL